MSVIVKGMEMPWSCYGCDWRVFRSEEPYCKRVMRACPSGNARPSWCPLAALPEKHGDLVDKRAMMDEAKRISAMIDKAKRFSWQSTGDGWYNWDVYTLIDSQPTIVEAEGD